MGSSRRQGSATLLHVREGKLRLGLALAVSFVLTLVAASPAMAGTASVSGDVLRYDALPGETNDITVTQGPASFTVTDASAPLSAGAGCTVAADTATCTGSIGSVVVELGDGNDIADVDGQVPSTVNGRLGADDISGSDGNDVVNGGPDADTVNIRGPGTDSVQCQPDDTIYADLPGNKDSVHGSCTPDFAPIATVDGPRYTNDTTPSFTLTPSEAGATFECMVGPVDTSFFGCGSPYTETTELQDGPYTLHVRASDAAPGPGPATAFSFRVDTQAPQVNVSPLLSTTPQATFQISSPDESAPVTFECAIDDPANLAPCGSSYTTAALPNGSYLLFVQATDAAGNTATYEFAVAVQVPAGGGGGGGGGGSNPPLQPRRIIIESLVLISGKPVKMSRKGEVSIRLQCAGTKTCKGRMAITTAEPVKRKSKKLERLGSTRFTIAANKSKKVKVRFSKAKRRLAKRLKRFKAKVVITEVDQRGNARISSRVFVLRAR